MTKAKNNPFAVQTPESTSAEDIVSLFVDVFTDFQHIPHPGHTFIHGPRGSGKTMMFRFLEPDCQALHRGSPLSEHPFFAVYVPIKNTALALTELLRLKGSHADHVLGEHFMALHVVARLIVSLSKVKSEDWCVPGELMRLYSGEFSRLLQNAGAPPALFPELQSDASAEVCLAAMKEVIERLHHEVVQYLRRLSFSAQPLPYPGALTGFLDFVVPLIQAVRRLKALPSGPFFLLLDDADNLSISQTQVLNSWVATRTTADISLKISTQLAYKTNLTVNDQRISSPHDYSEINISGVYTSRASKYQERMRQIVRKRLQEHGRTPDEFFPSKEEQEQAILAIAAKYRSRPEDATRGYQPRDDANRYSRPDYIKELSAKRGARANYSYAGFEQLVHISSGVVRHFLDAASLMYGEEQSKSPHEMVTQIPPATQDRVVRRLADDFFFLEFDSIVADAAESERGQFTRLRNLINALGNAFHEILISDAAERRVFSVALSDGGKPDVLEVLRLGVRYGYFHESTIGAKVGIGRVPLFILSRRLAPFFTLDPTSFAGYQFVTSEALQAAMDQPRQFIRKIKDKPGMEAVFENPQMRLPLEME